MTEKRFTFGDNINLVWDNVEEKSYGTYNITYLISLLNELHEENTTLKRRLRSVQSELFCKDRILEEKGIDIECCDK